MSLKSREFIIKAGHSKDKQKKPIISSTNISDKKINFRNELMQSLLPESSKFYRLNENSVSYSHGKDPKEINSSSNLNFPVGTLSERIKSTISLKGKTSPLTHKQRNKPVSFNFEKFKTPFGKSRKLEDKESGKLRNVKIRFPQKIEFNTEISQSINLSSADNEKPTKSLPNKSTSNANLYAQIYNLSVSKNSIKKPKEKAESAFDNFQSKKEPFKIKKFLCKTQAGKGIGNTAKTNQDNFLTISDFKLNSSFFGVFDGHGFEFIK